MADGGINDKYQLLAEMARLDDEFKAGKIAEDSYTKQRNELKLLLLKMIPKSDKQL